MIGFCNIFSSCYINKFVVCFGIFSAEEDKKITGAVTVADTPATAMAVSDPLPGMTYEEAQTRT